MKPVLIRNQFGGTLGGPLWKDHTFLFGDYEGTRQITRAVMQATVPNPDQSGTSALAIANGEYTFRNSTNGQTVALQNPITGARYANGVVPFSAPSVSAFAKGVLINLPQSNVPGTPYQNNYASQPRDLINDNKGGIRLDHTFTDDFLFGAQDSFQLNNSSSCTSTSGCTTCTCRMTCALPIS